MLVDGAPVSACTYLAIEADGRVSRYLDVIGTELGNSHGIEGRARRVTELLA